MRTLDHHRRMRMAFMLMTTASLFFISASFAQRVEGPYMTTDDVPVRKGPGTNYEVVATIPKGIKVHVVGKEGYWLKVQSKHGNPPGYIDDRYARPLESQPQQSIQSVEGVYVTTAEVNLREGPGLHYRVLTTLPKDIRINVVGAQGNWLKVESKHGKPPGYVEKRFAERHPNP